MAEAEWSIGESQAAEVGGEVELRFDHIGVVVARIEVGRQFLEAACGVRLWTDLIADPGLGVAVQFGMSAAGGPCYELIAPLAEGSAVSSALERGRNLLNHLAYRTSDLEGQGERLRALGCLEVAPAQPAVAYRGRRIQFWMTPLRFLLELIEAPEHQHSFLPFSPREEPAWGAEREGGDVA